MGMAAGGGKGTVANINMTPMIDVLLVLIIIFMVITPLTPRGFETLLPQPAPPGPQHNPADPRIVVVSVNKDRSVMINQDPTSMDRLGARLEQIFKTRAERVIFVKGDPDLDFQDVAKVIDTARGAGIDKVGLMAPQTPASN